MDVFRHHIYEYEKGIRKLVLFTANSSGENYFIDELEKHGISYLITNVSERKINIFFGSAECIEVLNAFTTLELDKLSNAEDFILGIMLGYDVLIQCKRFVSKVNLNRRENNLCLANVINQ